jgi:hypothetical protein
VILKIIPEASYGVFAGESRPIAEKQRRKPTNGRGKSSYRNSDAAFGTLFRISKFFEGAIRSFIFIFLFKREA